MSKHYEFTRRKIQAERMAFALVVMATLAAGLLGWSLFEPEQVKEGLAMFDVLSLAVHVAVSGLIGFCLARWAVPKVQAQVAAKIAARATR